MARKTIDEQIELAEKAAAIKNARVRELKARKRTIVKNQERKERTHRLIQIGAICEEVYGDAITEGAMQDALRNFLSDQDARGNFYSAPLNKAKEKAASVADATDAADDEIAGPDEII